jgi:polyribonucleotide nucleotidyltransferase
MMKEDVIAANLANLRQSVNELKETVNKLNDTSQNHVQTTQSAVDERTVYNSVAKSFCNCWNDALSILKKSVRKEQPDKVPFSKWIPKLINLLKQKFSLIDYLYVHVCDYNTNRLKIEANTERILERQDEILAKVNELRRPLTIIPPNVNGLFLRGYHFKLRYVIIVVIAIFAWAVAASFSSMKYKEEAFAYYSMYRAVKEQHQSFVEKWATTEKSN